ncbi:CRISPR-associated endonuclease Cas1 [Desulfosarcina ovata]|uniref:CRISPR-associated endonuclease Cas1 n=2 Tax=Desulfosarcina ovata TaxID=83564 RepID=A0A5K8A4E7_9BACT|nr:CRISPR-associated endonuclease Cas1 [Desulfosarcina ovata]BBO79921.1 CRISPR-associated endonuclease Cas1 1 [Desulfosarcina ovata subsp. sediminis]BBO87224.1 CRISPR-associated endonuclease Cas1 1 [Desulfosarcina ovata subsp. ovata]
MMLVIDRRESILLYKGGCLVLQRKGKKDRQIPVKPLEQVVIYGNPQVEAAVLRVLGEAGIPVAILPARGNQPPAFSGGGLAVQLPLRRRQHRLAEHPGRSLKMAKWFVQNKMNSYDLALATLRKLYPEKAEGLVDFCRMRDRTTESLQSAPSHASIMGLEGQLAHAWFSLLSKQLPDKWKFIGRNRRPPRDPVNALLSLGYTLLLSEVTRCVQYAGLDPSLGFLHRDYPGRESCALDFTEVFRSGVDCFVLTWLASDQIDSEGFYYREKTGCRLSKTARPIFYQAWAYYREEWPRPGGLITENAEVHFGSLRECVNGHIAKARKYMKQLEEQNEGIPA